MPALYRDYHRMPSACVSWVTLNYLFDPHQVGRIIFYIEQGVQRLDFLIIWRWCLRYSLSGSTLWGNLPDQFDPEFAAHSNGAVHADSTAHQFDQLFGHHEADTCPFRNAGFLPEAIERLK